MIKNEQIYYIYKDIDGNILVSQVFLGPLEVYNRQLWLAMETGSQEEMVDFVNEETYNNAGINVEMSIQREVF